MKSDLNDAKLAGFLSWMLAAKPDVYVSPRAPTVVDLMNKFAAETNVDNNFGLTEVELSQLATGDMGFCAVSVDGFNQLPARTRFEVMYLLVDFLRRTGGIAWAYAIARNLPNKSFTDVVAYAEMDI